MLVEINEFDMRRVATVPCFLRRYQDYCAANLHKFQVVVQQRDKLGKRHVFGDVSK